jgi:hypothetical protein
MGDEDSISNFALDLKKSETALTKNKFISCMSYAYTLHVTTPGTKHLSLHIFSYCLSHTRYKFISASDFYPQSPLGALLTGALHYLNYGAFVIIPLSSLAIVILPLVFQLCNFIPTF